MLFPEEVLYNYPSTTRQEDVGSSEIGRVLQRGANFLWTRSLKRHRARAVRTGAVASPGQGWSQGIPRALALLHGDWAPPLQSVCGTSIVHHVLYWELER